MKDNIQPILDLSYSHDDSIGRMVSSNELVSFLTSYTGKIVETTVINLTVTESMSLFYNQILNLIQPSSKFTIRAAGIRQVIMFNTEIFIILNDSNASHKCFYTSYDKRTISINIYGDPTTVINILNKIREIFATDKSSLPTLTWYYNSSNGMDYRDVKIKKPKPIKDSFYPWIKDGVEKYFDNYMKSESSIMVLLGEPGTAKTTFINNMIWKKSINTMFTYEAGLMNTDALFINFMIDDEKQLLLIEDADLLLMSREKDGNEIMSKFLNIGDGLMDITNKKIIFTANIMTASKIDPALLRPGRCFDCQVFRKLTYIEALQACQDANLNVSLVEGKSYTIAEIFALTQSFVSSPSITKLGF